MNTKKLADSLIKHRILLRYDTLKVSDDVPYYFSYTVKNPSAPILDGSAWNWNSTALSKNKIVSLNKAIIRSAELYSLFSYDKFRTVKYCKENSINTTLNINSFLDFSKSEFRYSTGNKYGWIKVNQIIDSKEEYIPAQLIATAYYSKSCYYTNNNENQLMNQYNTIYGLGSGKSVKEAIKNAFLDSYKSHTFYWHIKNNKIPKKIELSNQYLTKKMSRIVDLIPKNEYKISCFNLSLNQKIPVILTFIRGIHKTNKFQFGWSFTVGETFGQAIANSILASFSDLYRLLLIFKNLKKSNQYNYHPFFIERSRYNLINSILNRKTYSISKVDWNSGYDEKIMSQQIQKSRGWYLDVTSNLFKSNKLKVVKIFIPNHFPPFNS